MKENTIQKYLNQSFWFHATTESSLQSILENGVIASYNQGLPCDFGYGFYLTPTLKQAYSYITRNFKYSNLKKEKLIIIKFEFNISHHLEKSNFKVFPHYNQDFAEFVLTNRLYPNTQMHNHDMTLGVMSDQVPTKVLNEYINGIKTKGEVINAFMKWTSMEQLCLHSQTLCDKLLLKDIIYINEESEVTKNDK